jgi:hypothetical protein
MRRQIWSHRPGELEASRWKDNRELRASILRFKSINMEQQQQRVKSIKKVKSINEFGAVGSTESSSTSSGASIGRDNRELRASPINIAHS